MWRQDDCIIIFNLILSRYFNFVAWLSEFSEDAKASLRPFSTSIVSQRIVPYCIVLYCFMSTIDTIEYATFCYDTFEVDNGLKT